ncbi:hypothetical protein MAR_010645 [Mya arenaria]|uniref:Uncharacterized protein n=1 Tax=Mya arenaria TaxID=6604 RepID=A0ABY7G0R1_MYAAR|nr:hypothetical protein MAR_010645 [Mya arenaria]
MSLNRKAKMKGYFVSITFMLQSLHIVNIPRSL